MLINVFCLHCPRIWIFAIFLHYKSNFILHIFVIYCSCTFIIDSIPGPGRFFIPIIKMMKLCKQNITNMIIWDFSDYPIKPYEPCSNLMIYLLVIFHRCIIPSLAIKPFKIFIAASTSFSFTITVLDIQPVWFDKYFIKVF